MDTVNSENTYNIGIDFGASSCQVAVYTNDKVSAIPLDDDDTSIPACVYFGDNSILVGREAVLKELGTGLLTEITLGPRIPTREIGFICRRTEQEEGT